MSSSNSASLARDALAAIKNLQSKIAGMEAASREPIAIVGMASRLPGAEDGLDSFWELLVRETDATCQIPKDRWDADAFFDASPTAPNKASTKRGAFLSEVDKFDSEFFRITPREALAMDPQQRITLETSWEAIANSGLPLTALQRLKTGVFLGISVADYVERLDERTDVELVQYALTGNAFSIAAGRISYVFGLTGPTMAIDTACSSSLVAVHLACESLRNRSSDVALAGGVNLMLSPRVFIALSKLGALSPDGRCRTWDASAAGFGRGEGCGVVVLKRFKDAQANGDRIWAVIRGSAVNHDGHTSGLTAPNPLAQERVIRAALEFDGTAPDAVQYVEAHGTGTILGDPIEIEGLTRVFGERARSALSIGTVKTNIGHLEAAAGIAGLIKAVLSIQHRQIPASLHLKTPNPHIPFDELPIRVQTELGPWPRPEAPLVAGVSSFGLSGTNAHVLVTEAPATTRDGVEGRRDISNAVVLPISAKSLPALRAYAERFARALGQSPTESSFDIAFTASCRQTHLERRLCVVGRSIDEWVDKLRVYARGDSTRGVVSGDASTARSGVVFVFPGQGSQWLGMGRGLLDHEAHFTRAIEECDAAFRAHTDWSLIDQLRASSEASRLTDIDVVQPMLFAMQVGLTALWRSWGIDPSAVVGHSMGEAAAAYVCGALTLDDAAKVICIRSQLLRRVRGRGSMALVELTAGEAEEELRRYDGRVSIAASNGPRSTVVSGDATCVAALVETLQKRHVFCRPVKVDVASHSSQVDELRGELVERLGQLRVSQPSIPFASTAISDGNAPALDAAYWWTNLRQPVRLFERVNELVDAGNQIFLEISAHPTLTVAIEETVKARAVVVSSLRRDEPERATLLEGLGALHCAGYPVDWQRQYPAPGRVLSLPSYPWQRERYWVDAPNAATGARTKWPLIHTHVEASDQPGKHVFELTVDLNGELSYLSDHKVQGTPWFPGAAYVEMALEAADLAFGERAKSLRDLTLDRAMPLADNERTIVQLTLQPEVDGTSRFHIASRPLVDASEWMVHAAGAIAFHETAASAPVARNELKSRCSEEVRVDEVYDAFGQFGLSYGPAFQALGRAFRGADEALVKLVAPAELGRDAGRYKLFPGFLDAAFQACAVALGASVEQTFVPVAIESVDFFRSPVEGAWAHAAIVTRDPSVIQADVTIFDDAGRIVARIGNLRLQPLGPATDRLDQYVFDVDWKPVPRPSTTDRGGPWLLLCDESGLGEQIASRLRACGERAVMVLRGSEYARGETDLYSFDRTRPEFFERLFREEFAAAPPRFVVHLGCLDAAGADLSDNVLSRAKEEACTTPVALLQGIARMGWGSPPRVVLLTQRAQAARSSDDVQSPGQALLWGLGASAAHEFAELRPTLVDLDADVSPERLTNELAALDREDRVALRDDERLVARLVHRRRVRPQTKRRLVVGAEGYALEFASPGNLESLVLRRAKRRPPKPGNVEIRVRASGLNFRDVLVGSGMFSQQAGEKLPMGAECAGTVVAVGEGVTELAVGDEVVAASLNTFDAYVHAPASFAMRRPEHLSPEQAAVIPTAMMTVVWALDCIGRLRRGERVLIHAATGGVGLAAIQYARHVGAQIFATAGSDAKRAHLRALGIEHVYDSRSLDWADGVMRDTGGRGVDVVLNSLAGAAISKGLSVLSPFGRFLELGRRDIYANSQVGLYALRNNLSIAVIELEQLGADYPDEFAALLRRVFTLTKDGVFEPFAPTAFPISRAAEAFDYLARAKHIGKVVITSEDEVDVVDDTPRDLVRSDKTYLVTGGLGGLGLVVAERLFQMGARSIALLGRGQPTEAARTHCAALREKGAHVHVLSADVSDRTSLDAAVSTLARVAPPLGGVVHAAGVLDDATLLRLTHHQIEKVLAPKLWGTRNLCAAVARTPLDFFVLFSSTAAVFGSAGQAHYAAANAFLDAVAHWRHAHGSPAISIAWGAWSEVGMVARDDRASHVMRQGLGSFAPAEGAEMFERLLPSADAYVSAFSIDVRQWRQLNPRAAEMPLLRELAPSARRAQSSAILEEVRASSPDDAFVLLTDYLRKTIGRVTKIPGERIGVDTPFKDLGLDSLMMVSVKNAIEADLSLSLSTATLYSNPCLSKLARRCVRRTNAVRPGDAADAAPVVEASTRRRQNERAISAAAGDAAAGSEDVEELRRLVYAGTDIDE